MCSANDASIQINTNLKTYLAYGTDVSVVLTSHYFSSQVDALLFFSQYNRQETSKFIQTHYRL